jgi:hypothetical protein
MKNDCLEAALHELELAGIRDVDQAHGGKHLQLRWSVNGHIRRVYTLPCTPSDPFRGPKNTRAQIRRLLRDDGVLQQTPKAQSTGRPPDRIAKLEQRVAALEQIIRTQQSPTQIVEEFIPSVINVGA